MLASYNDSVIKNYFGYDPFHVFDELYSTPRTRENDTASYSVNRTDSGMELVLDLPGVKSSDLSVQVAGRDLKIDAKRQGKSLKYSFKLSKDYSPDSAEASLENGVLTVSFSKSEELKPKTLEVKVK
jgi:HSP20 family molecular chaperone IbpA